MPSYIDPSDNVNVFRSRLRLLEATDLESALLIPLKVKVGGQGLAG